MNLVWFLEIIYSHQWYLDHENTNDRNALR